MLSFIFIPFCGRLCRKRIFFKDRDEEIYCNRRGDFLRFMQIRFLIPHRYPLWSEQPEADFILLVGDFCFPLAPAGPVFWVFAFLSQWSVLGAVALWNLPLCGVFKTTRMTPSHRIWRAGNWL